MNHANTILLIKLGFHVIEHRARRKNKTLTDWKPAAAFMSEDEADDYLARFEKSGYYRSVCEIKEQPRPALTPCHACQYEYDREGLGKYGCPNCHGEGLE